MYLNCLKLILQNDLPLPFISLKAILSGSAYQDRRKTPLCYNNVFFPQRLRDISLFSQSENRTSTIRKMTISVTVVFFVFFCLHTSVWRKLKRPISNCKINNKRKIVYISLYILYMQWDQSYVYFPQSPFCQFVFFLLLFRLICILTQTIELLSKFLYCNQMPVQVMSYEYWW